MNILIPLTTSAMILMSASALAQKAESPAAVSAPAATPEMFFHAGKPITTPVAARRGNCVHIVCPEGFRNVKCWECRS